MIEKKVKILFFQPSLRAGGVERFSLDLALEFQNRGYEVSFLLYVDGGFFREEALERGIAVKVLKKRGRFDFINFLEIKKFIKKSFPDIIISHLGANMYVPYVSGKIPVLAVEDNINKDESFLVTKAKKMAYRRLSCLVAVSEAVKKDCALRYSLDLDKIKVVYNGVDFSRFRNYQKEDRSCPLIGSVGRLEKQKNYELLIRALAEISGDFRCYLVGEGSQKEALIKLVKEKSLKDKVIFLGLEKNIGSFLSSLDFFVLPSRWEGLGIVLLEAAYYALPVIASRVDGITEILSEDNAYLFTSEDQEALKNKIKYLLDNYRKPEVISKGLMLKEHVVNNFSLVKIADDYEKIIISL